MLIIDAIKYLNSISSNLISREKGERINQTQYSNFAKSVKILHGIKCELPKKFLCFNENHSSVTQLTRNKDKKSATTFSVLHGLNFLSRHYG